MQIFTNGKRRFYCFIEFCLIQGLKIWSYSYAFWSHATVIVIFVHMQTDYFFNVLSTFVNKKIATKRFLKTF